MKRIVIATISTLVIIAAAVAVYYQASTQRPLGEAGSDSLLNARFGVTNITEHYGNTTAAYSVYLAATPQQSGEGYMNVSTIGNCNNATSCLGMLFIFPNETELCFWMENTAIPLRQTWLNQSGYPIYSYIATPYSQQSICSYGKYVMETAPNTSIQGYVTFG